MIHIDVRADVRHAKRFLSATDKGVDRAAARALNDTAITVRAEGARAIQLQHPALLIGAIKRAMTTTRASPGRLTATVETTGKPLSMLLFRTAGGIVRRKGITPVTAIIGTGKRSILMYRGRKAFKISKWGGEVFVRRSPTGRFVRRLRGPSMPGVFRAQGKKFKAVAQRRWATTFKSRMDYEIERAKR